MAHVARSTWTHVALVVTVCSYIVASSQPAAQVIGEGARGGSASPRESPSASPLDAEGDWPNIHIKDVYTRDAARRALRSASQWLARPKCQTLFDEFKDARDLPLAAKLGELHASPEQYLRMVLFLDGAQKSTCQIRGILAFTAPGSRVVYLCGREFERGWRRDSREVQATIIHELLHSLGLQENPPSPRHITDRVQRLCWD